MREILFRGKRKDNGEWVYGYLFDDGLVDGRRMFVGFLVITDYKGQSDDKWEVGYDFYEVIPETVGQWIGLTDKNGKKVFEGDILAYHLDDFDHETISGVIKYGNMNCSCCDGVYGWYIEGGDIRVLDMEFLFDDDERLYIVGNIHDSPELLEVEK